MNSTLASWLSLLFSTIALILFFYIQIATFNSFDAVAIIKGKVKGFNPWSTTEYLLTGTSLLLISIIGYFLKSIILTLTEEDTQSGKSIFRISISIIGASILLLVSKNLAGNSLLPNLTLFNTVNQIINAVVPVLIGVMLIIYGFRTQIPLWRKIGLVFIAIIVVKLHLIDVWGYTGIMKIVTFISLGIMMLAASFLFQKIKKVIE
jgi:hypothetical protein